MRGRGGWRCLAAHAPRLSSVSDAGDSSVSTTTTVLVRYRPPRAIDRVARRLRRHHAASGFMPSRSHRERAGRAGSTSARCRRAGGGLAILKWVTRFPATPQGLPVVMGSSGVSDDAGRAAARADRRAGPSRRCAQGAVPAVDAPRSSRARKVQRLHRRTRTARGVGRERNGRRGVRTGRLLRHRSDTEGADRGRIGLGGQGRLDGDARKAVNRNTVWNGRHEKPGGDRIGGAAGTHFKHAGAPDCPRARAEARRPRSRAAAFYAEKTSGIRRATAGGLTPAV